tara:strand:- start:216 stop:575 length:360 start_codon:yes stop_codon:yes gene_type:complete
MQQWKDLITNYSGGKMPSKSKTKGNTFERLIVNKAKDLGLEAKRAWGSNGRSIGWHEEVDVLIDNSFTIQAKCRKKLADFLIPSEHVKSVVFKQDRGETLILLRFDDFLENHYMKPGGK